MKNVQRHKIAALMIFVMLAGAVPIHSYATSTQEQLNQAEEDKKNLEQQHQETEEKLDGLKGEQKSLKGELKKLNKQLTEVSEHLEDLESQISVKEQELADTAAALEEAKATEQWQYECMKIRIQYMYEQNDIMYLDSVFSAGSFGDFLNFNEYFEQLTSYDQMMFDEYVATREYIESEEARLTQEKIELDNLKLAAEAEKNTLAGLIGQTSKSIAKYADQIEDAEAEAEAYEAKIKEKEKDIKYLKKKIAEEIAMSQAAANAKWRDISEVSFSEGDRYLLANLIYCEAGNQPYAGKLAVGAVVINRVLSSKYPDTLVGVVYQKNQFSPAGSGRLELSLAGGKATAECYRAADEAMSGITNVGTCLYFRTPVEGLNGITIGGHVFY